MKYHFKIYSSGWNLALKFGLMFHHLMVVGIEATEISSTCQKIFNSLGVKIHRAMKLHSLPLLIMKKIV